MLFVLILFSALTQSLSVSLMLVDVCQKSGCTYPPRNDAIARFRYICFGFCRPLAEDYELLSKSAYHPG